MKKILMINDEQAWNNCHPDDYWIFDKLLLSKKLGYVCGPHGVDVPKPGNYVVRPCVNLMGMGLGAEIKYLEKDTDNEMEPGTFWCKVFKGAHYSVDFYNKKQVLCVQGHKDGYTELNRWSKWEKKDKKFTYPKILEELTGQYEYINVEYKGGKVIEVHLRQNPDFMGHNSDYIKPVWQEQKNNYTYWMKKGEKFIHSPDVDRIGYIINE